MAGQYCGRRLRGDRVLVDEVPDAPDGGLVGQQRVEDHFVLRCSLARRLVSSSWYKFLVEEDDMMDSIIE